jgi:hypothetical protein
MMLTRLQGRLASIATAAASAARDRIIARVQPPRGVQVSASDGGITLSGRRLRRRFITDPSLRRLLR